MDVPAELVGKKRNYSKKLMLTDSELIMEWDSPGNKGRRGWHFDFLSPEIGFAMERPSGFKEGVIGGAVLLAAAIILFFSRVPEYVPLLVPALAILGMVALISGISKYKKETWTVFYKKDGDMAAHMEHSMANASEIKAFENAFKEAMSRHSPEAKRCS